MRVHLPSVFCLLLISLFPGRSSAGPSSNCQGPITRANVVPCALLKSPLIRADESELKAAQARRTAASPLLPANPVVSFSLARRRETGGPTALNWHASLEQELEIAGQRGTRRRAAGAFAQAQNERLAQTRRDVAAMAWNAYFDAAAAHERQVLTARLAEGAQAVATVARARADQGLVAPVEADVAEAASIKAWQAQLAAERERADADAALAALLGRAPSAPLALNADLTALPASFDDHAQTQLASTPEVRAREAERRAYERQADAYRRARVPNPTISVFAENDGFDERVFGVGLAIPLPLPGNIGRTYIGEIAEADALSARAAAERDVALRDTSVAHDRARRAFASRTRELEAFTPERLERARRSLRSVREEVEAGRLAVRDAVILQQAMLELLEADLAARLAWCLTSVELARISGASLEKVTP